MPCRSDFFVGVGRQSGKDDGDDSTVRSAVARHDLNAAAMSLNNFFRNPQAQAGADILLGGEKRLEYFFANSFGNSRPVIFKGKVNDSVIGLFDALEGHDDGS